jgi:hypothetical protein
MIKYYPDQSDKPIKKYFIITKDNKKVYFGTSGYSDFSAAGSLKLQAPRTGTLMSFLDLVPGGPVPPPFPLLPGPPPGLQLAGVPPAARAVLLPTMPMVCGTRVARLAEGCESDAREPGAPAHQRDSESPC